MKKENYVIFIPIKFRCSQALMVKFFHPYQKDNSETNEISLYERFKPFQKLSWMQEKSLLVWTFDETQLPEMYDLIAIIKKADIPVHIFNPKNNFLVRFDSPEKAANDTHHNILMA